MAEVAEREFNSLVYEIVSEIPAGYVATYGQVACLIGFPKHARQVGRALSKLPKNSTVPWHRVVNAKGELHCLHDGEISRQQHKLEAEGLCFTQTGRVSLTRYQWR